MNLTGKEFTILHWLYSNREEVAGMDFDELSGSLGLPVSSIKGVTGSLVRKGFAESMHFNGTQYAVAITDEGIEELTEEMGWDTQEKPEPEPKTAELWSMTLEVRLDYGGSDLSYLVDIYPDGSIPLLQLNDDPQDLIPEMDVEELSKIEGQIENGAKEALRATRDNLEQAQVIADIEAIKENLEGKYDYELLDDIYEVIDNYQSKLYQRSQK